ncbi:MAG TPA: hypothetical protein VEP30_07315 [Chthoniobacterales bacterium]|nr:hypothetical protein [Chthoniobacterales bacterium]
MALILLTTISTRALGQLRSADLPPAPYATITYSNGSSVVAPGGGGTFPLIGLQPTEAVQVTVQYPPGQPPANASNSLAVIVLQALDGGILLPPAGTTAVLPGLAFGFNCDIGDGLSVCPFLALVADTTGKLVFTFVPGLLPGSYRVALRHGTRAMLLEFWVEDLANLQNNPPAITAAQPDNY